MSVLCGEINLIFPVGRLSSSGGQEVLVNRTTTSIRNPWISSIAGRYIWNTKVTQLDCYFVSSSDEEIVERAGNLLSLDSFEVLDWSEEGKLASIECCQLVSNFLRKDSNENTYENSKIVFVYFSGSIPFAGLCVGPQFIFTNPETVDNKVWIFINDAVIGPEVSFSKGSATIYLLLHEIGHAFGLSHPHDTGAESTIMPGVSEATESGVCGQNHVFNTVMSYVFTHPKLPLNLSWDIGDRGYPETFMPYDYACLRLLYKISFAFTNSFINKWGTQTMNRNRTQCFIGNSSLFVNDETGRSILCLQNPSVDPRRSLNTITPINSIEESFGVLTVDEASRIRRVIYNNNRQNSVIISSLQYSAHLFLNGSSSVILYIGFINTRLNSPKTTILIDVNTGNTLTIVNNGSGIVTFS